MLVQQVLKDIFKTSIDMEGKKLDDKLKETFPKSNISSFNTSTDWEFISKKVNSKERVELPPEQRCLARVWGGSCGSQCTRRFASGSEFCAFHGKETNKIVRRRNGPDGFFAKNNWEVHGRVDKPFQARDINGNVLYSGKLPWWMPAMKDALEIQKMSEKSKPVEKKQVPKQESKVPEVSEQAPVKSNAPKVEQSPTELETNTPEKAETKVSENQVPNQEQQNPPPPEAPMQDLATKPKNVIKKKKKKKVNLVTESKSNPKIIKKKKKLIKKKVLEEKVPEDELELDELDELDEL